MIEDFRIPAFEDSLHEIPAGRSKLPGQPTIMTVLLHARVDRPAEFEPLLEVMIKMVTDTTEENKILSMPFDRPEIPLIFSSALLGGLLFVLQTSQRNVPLLVCSSSDFLSRTLVKERWKFENDMLGPNFKLFKAVFAALNERVARIQFKKVTDNQAKFLTQTQPQDVEIDTDIDLMFECP
jgi:hypothetical protein